MDIAVLLAIWAAIVVVTMLVVAYLAVRWGHDPFGWLLLCVVIGPIALIALYGTHQRDAEQPHTYAAAPRAPAAGHPVLLAVDGSAASERAARYVAETHPDSLVLVLAVLPQEARDRESAEERRARLARLTFPALQILRDAGVAAEEVAGYGAPGEEILRCARESDAEAIVVGKRGAGLTRALLGSVSDYVVKHADRPVVTVD